MQPETRNPKRETLAVFFGEANDALARVYARIEGPREPGLALSGRVIGPFCQYANTLPAHVPLIDKGLPLVDKETAKPSGDSMLAEAPLLAEAIVPDPCFWTPELPFQYRVQIELRRGSDVLETAERSLGIRRLGPRGRDLFLEGKRFVIRAVSVSDHPSRLASGVISQLPEFHDAATTLCVTNPSNELCELASGHGVLLIAEVTGNIGAELRRLAQWPAVGIAALEQGTNISPEARAAAPNLLLAERMTSVPASPAPWAQLLLCEMNNPSPSGRGQGEGGSSNPSPLRGEDKVRGAAEGTDVPILVERRLKEPLSLTEARAACDQLQAELAPLNFAGYLV